MASADKELVLVTGGSGFLAQHCIVKLLNSSYRVRATLRSLKRENEVRDALKSADTPNLDDLSFVVAELGSDDGWADAVKDCAYVLHVASPFPASKPKHEDELIVPAREGTLRVLRAARDAGVRRVVVTSSFGAVGYGQGERDASNPFTEKDWTVTDGSDVTAYLKSKTVAERAAWDWAEKEAGSLELSVVNPVLILGPLLSADGSASIEIVTRLMNGSMPACPRLNFNLVDVRDCADLHLLAMTHPDAKGERFLATVPPSMGMKDMSLALRKGLGNAARRCPTRDLPDFLLKFMAWFDSAVGLVIGDLGKVKESSGDKARQMLGWQPRSAEEAVLATGESLVKLGLIKP